MVDVCASTLSVHGKTMFNDDMSIEIIFTFMFPINAVHMMIRNSFIFA